ncbi:MAG: sensor domain-containing diguanylate cyclase [Candidatus Moraniibacteriota bacterium]
MEYQRRRQLQKESPIEQTYRSLVENIKDYAIFMMDKKGIITSWDQGACELFGYTRRDIIGKNFSILFIKEDFKKKIPQSDMATSVAEGRQLDERQYARKDKTKFWSSGVLTSSRDKAGRHQGFSKIMRDVTEQTDLHRTAVHNSTHDFLTGLPNRSFFEESIIESIARAKKKEILVVLYMDFNNFKRTNDVEGHRYGDLVLIEIAHRLSQSIRKSDVAARFGGDEFVILAKNLKNKAEVAHFAKKIIQVFREPILIKRRIIHTSVSTGVSMYSADGKKPSDLLRFADLALYQAKKLGGNQFQFYDKTIDVREDESHA